MYPYRMQCRACGFEPLDASIAPLRCPKCATTSWERYTIPGSLLMDADYYAGRVSGFRHCAAALRASQPNPNEASSCCDEL